jgi:hypothetical protein
MPDPVPSVQIKATDANMARVAEDIIAAFIKKGLLSSV